MTTYALNPPISISNPNVSNLSTPANWSVGSRNCRGLISGSYYACSYSLENQVHKYGLSLKSEPGFRKSEKKAYKMSANCVIGDGSGEVHDDGYYMRKCVELARKAVGFTSPNPMVGCIIVKDGKIVGQGFHPKAGQPHAEVFALRDAGDMAENATAYVTLEPCNHYGRTPPCSEALIKAKIKRVVVGMVDPNPIVASKGVQRLRDAGIDVTVCVEEELCKKMLEAYTHKMLTGNLFVTLRYSLSVNGQVLDQLGENVMDSGGYYSKLLQENDSVIYSSALLSSKFSVPESKEPGANQPLQAVLAKSPPSPAQIVDFAGSKMVVFSENETTGVPDISQNGIEVVVTGRQRLLTILEYCSRQGHCSVLLDVRGDSADFEEILREGFEHNLFQKVVAEVQPFWVGKLEEPWNLLGKPLQLKNLTSRDLAGSVLLEGYF